MPIHKVIYSMDDSLIQLPCSSPFLTTSQFSNLNLRTYPPPSAYPSKEGTGREPSLEVRTKN